MIADAQQLLFQGLNDWENIEYMYAAQGTEGIMSMALNKWKVSKHSKPETPSLKDLSDALTAVNLSNHLICQVQSV